MWCGIPNTSGLFFVVIFLMFEYLSRIWFIFKEQVSCGWMFFSFLSLFQFYDNTYIHLYMIWHLNCFTVETNHEKEWNATSAEYTNCSNWDRKQTKWVKKQINLFETYRKIVKLPGPLLQLELEITRGRMQTTYCTI